MKNNVSFYYTITYNGAFDIVRSNKVKYSDLPYLCVIFKKKNPFIDNNLGYKGFYSSLTDEQELRYKTYLYHPSKDKSILIYESYSIPKRHKILYHLSLNGNPFNKEEMDLFNAYRILDMT